MANHGQRHLVCSLGISDYAKVAYRLEDRTHSTRFAPVALAHLLGLRGGRASVLVTEQARERWYAILAAELRLAGLEPEPVNMPEASNEAEVLEAFRRLVEAVPGGEQVILDVTYSFRHLPFVYLAGLTYLTAHRDVAIDGIYYGAFELRPKGAAGTVEVPMLEVTSLFRLIQWYHAVRTARESGDLRALAWALHEDVSKRRSAGFGHVLVGRW